ncbi:hypothetical protein CDL12_16377 [Handroanthus impetiginosus]|uniref:FRIGIDA-like protein n=1 Tax=Handroanthus impetiginosus TaxID=429701 RepID=A0A2G9H0I3_9LAMI|nr:hypothetical protein CDL12_16377 [Handroanthus impetiginosus]
MEKLLDALSDRTSMAENLMKYLRESFQEIECRQRNLDLVRESVVGRMMDIEQLRESLEKGSRDLEERKKEFEAFKEGKKRKLASEEDELSLKRENFLNDVKMKEEELNEQLVSVHEHGERLKVEQSEVQGIRRQLCMKLKEIESQEQNLRSARESLAEKERKVNLIIDTLDGRINAVEEREKKFDLFLEGKMRELVAKEEQLSVRWEEFVKEVKVADDKFSEQEKLRNCLLGRLELAEDKLEGMRARMDERFNEIEFRENMAWELVKEADLIRKSVEKKLQEFEKVKTEFDSFQEDKNRELVSKEKQLILICEEAVKDAELRDEKLSKREKLGHQLLKRLELALVNVENLKKVVHDQFREIDLKKIELNSATDWVEGKMDEVDIKTKKLDEKEKIIMIKEDNVISKEIELQRKKEELDLKEKNLASWQKELEVKQREVNLAQALNDQQLEEFNWRDKNLNSVREFTRKCFKKYLAMKKQLLFERDLVEKRARYLDHKEQQLECTVREIELKDQLMRDYVRELELKHQVLTDSLNANVNIKPDESVDLKLIVRMDGKTLQMFLNDPEKDLESMGDEIFKVLHLSPDPAKLVLDAMVGFYPPHLREGDIESNVRRTCIILLAQLPKMSLKVQPCVREEALELASAWKLKMRATAENPLEVLGFLHLLAAYNLASYFDEDEILSLLMMVSQHRRTPNLCHILGFTDSITGLCIARGSGVAWPLSNKVSALSFYAPPQARKASQSWFLEKLKERVMNAAAPYDLGKSAGDRAAPDY